MYISAKLTGLEQEYRTNLSLPGSETSQLGRSDPAQLVP